MQRRDVDRVERKQLDYSGTADANVCAWHVEEREGVCDGIVGIAVNFVEGRHCSINQLIVSKCVVSMAFEWLND